jgi:hypothetical protein
MEQKNITWIGYLGAFLYSSVLTIPLVIYASFLFFRVKIKKSKERLMSDRIFEMKVHIISTILQIIFLGFPVFALYVSFDLIFYILLFLPISTLLLFIFTFIDYIDPQSEGLPSLISSIKKAMVTFLGDDFKEYLNDDQIAE